MQKATKIVMDPFCFKQFEKQAGSLFIDMTIEEFTARVNDFYLENQGALKPGYAPFCKHLFIPNFTSAVSGCKLLTPENQVHLKSGYEARRPNELAVLCQWLDINKVPAHKAAFLDIILYSYDQVQKENESMGQQDPNAALNYDYGIVSVKPQDVDVETPMQPITMMRNALGKEHGGSGVPLDFEKYSESVEYWKKHAILK